MRQTTHSAEQNSQHELAGTKVTRGTAKFMTLGFLGLLAFPTTLQLMSGSKDPDSVKQIFQPYPRAILTAGGRFGSEMVTIGREGWLYYTPGLDYLYGRGLLDQRLLAIRTKSMLDREGISDPHPDPMPALEQLAEDCRQWGIHLILFPVPDKAQFVPEPLGIPTGTLLQNPDFSQFVQRMEAHGAQLVELAPDAAFLKQDTHWRPSLMDKAAQSLASAAGKYLSPAPTQRRYQTSKGRVSNFGDLVDLLKLPQNQSIYPLEEAEVEIVDPNPIDEKSEVLLLGDSFSLVYSSGALHWGMSSGLGEHLALHLNRPVDVIAMNGSAATAVRQELYRAATSGQLSLKRVLIYEFTVRDLVHGDWKPIPLPAPPKRDPPSALQSKQAVSPLVEVKPKPSSALIVRGQIEFLSAPLNPLTTPYKEGLQYAKVRIQTVESGEYRLRNAIVVFIAMRDRKLLPGGLHSVGDSVRLRLVPLAQASAEVRGMKRSDQTADYDLAPMLVVEDLK